MESLVPLLTIIYFVTIILAIYHLHQKELDRICNKLDQLSQRQDRAAGAHSQMGPSAPRTAA